MIDKVVESMSAAVADIRDGATVMIGGFGTAGMPSELIDALIAQGAKNLTIVNNNAGNGDTGLAALLKARRVKKIICSFPRQADSWVFDGLYKEGQIELELVPQGNLACRIVGVGAVGPDGAFWQHNEIGPPLRRLVVCAAQELSDDFRQTSVGAEIDRFAAAGVQHVMIAPVDRNVDDWDSVIDGAGKLAA